MDGSFRHILLFLADHVASIRRQFAGASSPRNGMPLVVSLVAWEAARVTQPG
jgi:hypothetical protein